MIFALWLLIGSSNSKFNVPGRYLQSRFYHFHISYYLQNLGKSFIYTNSKTAFIQPDFFVSSGFYLLQKRQVLRVTMHRFVHNPHSISGGINPTVPINIVIIISHDSPHMACVFISNRNRRFIIATLFFDTCDPTTDIIRFVVCTFNH